MPVMNAARSVLRSIGVVKPSPQPKSSTDVALKSTDVRPGMMTRPPYWWPAFERHVRRSETPIRTAVHHGPDGPDGFVVYTTYRMRSRDGFVLDVVNMHSANSAAFAGLWRYLLSVDLIDRCFTETLC